MTIKDNSLSLTQKKNPTQQRFSAANVSNMDRLVRAILGSAFLAGSVYSADPTLSFLGAVLILLSIPLINSAIIGWDPIYAIFKIRTATFRTNDARHEKNRIHKANGGINNIGTIDRILRVSLASVLFALPALLAGPIGYATATGTMVGILVMMTAVTGWDPIYQLLKIRTVTLPVVSCVIRHTPIDELALIDDLEDNDEDIFQKAA